MLRYIFVIVFFFITLNGRENPFFPPDDSVKIPYTTNKIKKIKEFEQTSIKLPDTARIIKKVTITYKNLDGSISSKSVELENKIDWHKPIIVLQENEEEIKKLKKKIKKEQKEEKKEDKLYKIGSLKFISFEAKKDKLYIKTKDKIIRDFKLVLPDRIVIDFKRDADFRSYIFKSPTIFKKIVVGNHKGYYRAVITLDGKYGYFIKPFDDYYLVELK